MSKKNMVSVFLLCAFAVIILGCGVKTKTAPSAETSSAVVPVMTVVPVGGSVMTRNAENATVAAWGWDTPEFNKIVEDYIKESSGVTVRGQTMSGADELQKITVASAAGTGLPDCFKATSSEIPRLVSLGSIRDITDLAKPYMDHLPKIAWDMVTYEGKIWALPANSPAAGMFYRSDVLEKYGINPDDLTTWDAWIEAGKKVVRESNGKVMWFNAPKDQVGYYIDNTIFQQYRAEILSSDGKVTVNSQEYRNALSLIERIRDEKLSAPIEDWTAPWYQTMKDGTLACYGSGTWFVQTIIQQAPDTKGKWYFSPFPAIKAGGDRYPNYGSASCFISSQTKNVDAAFEWCKAWSIDPRGSLDIGLKELGISVVSTAALDNNFVNQPHEYFAKNQAYWLDATKAFSNGIYVPPVLIQSGEASGIWNRYYEEWQLGKISTNDALSQAETELKTKLRL